MSPTKPHNANRDKVREASAFADSDPRAFLELLFFAYRDFTGIADAILEDYGFGRAHHRVIYFTGRRPGLSVSELLTILNITKQSLNRVLSQLVDEGYILQKTDAEDRRRRQLYLTEKGITLEQELTAVQGALIDQSLALAGADAAQGFRQCLEGLMTSDDLQQFRRGLTNE